MLRAAARQRGGIEIGGKREAHTGSFSPDCETSFLTSENKMIQTFSPYVKLEADLTSGKVSIIAEEEEIAVYNNPTMTELSMIQRDAQNIAVQIGK
ncbi:MAG: hypothetical protein LIP05_10185 [Tannerellaceae bacterium]|nr:hypothetical protein [Tannerellaceae bacterium]